MKLLVDLGNTRVKWAVADGEELTERGVFDALGKSSSLEILCDENTVERAVVASVAGSERNSALSKHLLDNYGIKPEFVAVEKERDGLRVAYRKVGNLGVDRWLAMLAAWQKYRHGCVVIDAGSAITVDFLSSNGAHDGGLIVPGLSMMRQALFSQTHGVKPSALELRRHWQPGIDTLPCVENGVSAVVKGFLSEISSKAGARAITVTGGDAEVIAELIDAGVEIDPNLVFKGLLGIS